MTSGSLPAPSRYIFLIFWHFHFSGDRQYSGSIKEPRVSAGMLTRTSFRIEGHAKHLSFMFMSALLCSEISKLRLLRRINVCYSICETVRDCQCILPLLSLVS